MFMQVRMADGPSDIKACQQLIAEVYGRYYGVTFSYDRVDPDACIESYPDRYLVGLVNGEIVAVTGLYVEQTYIERFGGVTNAEIDAMLAAAGVAERYSSRRKLEATKLVVRDGWTGRGLARKLHVAAQSREFLQRDDTQPYIITVCAKLSVFHHLYTEVGIRTRTIKPFPEYPAHERYRSPKDPMESRLIIPDLDIPSQWYNFRLPAELDLDRRTRRAPL
ncbi:MAG TPA: hypothetical protein VH877_32755 [Polyangia bacterium]|jgi:hypothetical protein|nr:hypothetical protein [Polyangia bacterium]